MLNIALKLLEKIEQAGFQAYLVGGFVRDYVLGKESHDIDIATSAKPMDIKNIFKEACLPHEDYGSITVVVKNIRFEITTFRKESSYIDHRRPLEFEYITDLVEDLRRRDFTMNTLCMNKDGQILDYFGGLEDIKRKIIRAVGNGEERLKEDALRILRAVRFSTTLNFTLSDDVVLAINKTKKYLSLLSYHRKREELDKIFTSKHVKEGIDLILSLGLDKELELKGLDKVIILDDLLGIWSCLEVEDKYPFTSNEKELLRKINLASQINNFDPLNLYHYGLYVNTVAAEKKGFDKKKVTKAYNNLPIYSKKDIKISAKEIMDIFNMKQGRYISLVMNDLEEKILKNIIINDPDTLKEYIKNNKKLYLDKVLS